jgi:hypothetical protein
MPGLAFKTPFLNDRIPLVRRQLAVVVHCGFVGGGGRAECRILPEVNKVTCANVEADSLVFFGVRH